MAASASCRSKSRLSRRAVVFRNTPAFFTARKRFILHPACLAWLDKRLPLLLIPGKPECRLPRSSPRDFHPPANSTNSPYSFTSPEASECCRISAGSPFITPASKTGLARQTVPKPREDCRLPRSGHQFASTFIRRACAAASLQRPLCADFHPAFATKILPTSRCSRASTCLHAPGSFKVAAPSANSQVIASAGVRVASLEASDASVYDAGRRPSRSRDFHSLRVICLDRFPLGRSAVISESFEV